MGFLNTAKKLAESRARGGANFLKHGKGKAIVKRLIQDKMYKGETFVAELLIDSNEPTKPGAETNVVGTTVSFIQQFDEYPDTAYGNVKAFLYALLGETDASLATSALTTKAELENSEQMRNEVSKILSSPQEPIQIVVGPSDLKNGKLGTNDWDFNYEFGLAYARLTSAENPARGMAVGFETYDSKPTKTGTILVLPRWSHVQQVEADIAAQRAKLDGGT